MSSFRRSTRSAKTPPASVRTNPGEVAMNPSTPSQKGEFESCNTSQPWATACIQVPVLERNAPDQKSRKLRCRSERNITLTPRPGSFCVLISVDISMLITRLALCAKGERDGAHASLRAFAGHLRVVKTSEH